ncbi:hypothetical protein TNCV_518921 [Trichonephila clavipes]|nr:hypothetical protein TNCV_518921 [Trichonephila clavipes]
MSFRVEQAAGEREKEGEKNLIRLAENDDAAQHISGKVGTFLLVLERRMEDRNRKSKSKVRSGLYCLKFLALSARESYITVAL